MAKGDDIEEKLIDFAVRIINLCDNLPKTRAGNHIAGQLLRSGTAPVALYAEARGAESTKDFIHKLKLCLKELNESRVWLKIITKSEILPKAKHPIHNPQFTIHNFGSGLARLGEHLNDLPNLVTHVRWYTPALYPQ